MSLLSKHATSPPADAPSPHDPTDDVSASGSVVEAQIPTVVSAAWELELIISGAVTFALFQLPGTLDGIRGALEQKATGGAIYVLFIVYLYAKVVVYALLAAFVLNLTARSYWVGLVGLHSVYPHGIDWDRAKLGPAVTETYRARLSSLPAIIARVDNFASIIFSFAFLVVVACMLSLVGSAVLGAAAWAIATVAFGGRHSVAIFETFALGGAVAIGLVSYVDQKYGARYASDSPQGRWIRRVVGFFARTNGIALFGPIYFTLSTNLRRGVMLSIFYLTFFGAVVLAIGQYFADLGLFAASSPRYIPDTQDVRTVDADFYESLRTTSASPSVPTIQSDVIDGPYVRLFIPYIPDQYDAAIATTCPGTPPLRSAHLHVALPPNDTTAAGRAADAVLGCLARMHRVTVDGAPTSSLHFRFYRHPATGRDGVIGYLPTAGLAPGAHTLMVRKPPREGSTRAKKPVVPWEISFWK